MALKLTDRERSILPALPLVAVVLVYTLWFMSSYRPKLTAARTALEAAQAAAVPPAAIDAQRAENEKLRREAESHEANKARLAEQVAALARHPSGAARRIDSLSKLTALFRRHGLLLVEDGPLGGGQGTSSLPPSLAEALGRLSGKQSGGTTGELRNYTLVGSYLSLLEAVRELAADEAPPGVPVSLTMVEVDPSSASRTWRLVLWM